MLLHVVDLLESFNQNHFSTKQQKIMIRQIFETIVLQNTLNNRPLVAHFFGCENPLCNRPWWPSDLSRHVSNSSKDRCLGPGSNPPWGMYLYRPINKVANAPAIIVCML